MMIRFTKALFLSASVLGLSCASAMAGPASMTADEARHLIARTGFGAAPHEVAALTGMSYADGVAQIMAGLTGETITPMPAWANGWAYPAEQIYALGQTEGELFFANRWLELQHLSGWWITEMATTPAPLQERLVLHWSDHFANSFDGHENPQWMAAQNQFLRENAAGDFATLAEGMLLDPSMLVFLDNVDNIAEAPNENLGREFLELFTLGEGRGYTQDDVRAAARMLTGYTINDMSGTPVSFSAEDHDDGTKTLFGQSGRFDASDLVDLTLSHPDFGPYIVEGLWRAFISDTPDPDEVARLTALWQANDLDLAPLLEAMFLSDAFWDPANRGRLVKSPVEMVVGATRTLGLSHGSTAEVAWLVSDLDQTFFLPPNVGGWPQGSDWINDATATARVTALTYLMWSDDEPYETDEMQMMMAAAPSAEVMEAGPDDLRVGQVFATWTEDYDEGWGGLFMLYDVGFGGETWRSISLWLEFDAEEQASAVYLYTGDCTCLQSLPGDGDGWVAFEPFEEMLDAYPRMETADIALMQAVATHLPAIVESTAQQATFTDAPYEDDDWVPSDPAKFVRAATAFARDTAALIGTHEAAYVAGFSRPDALGLQGLNQVGNEDDIDAYMEAREIAMDQPFVPTVTYPSLGAWADALPGDGPLPDRIAAALLAVPPQTVTLTDRRFANDPEALIRALLLSPEFQVN